MNIILLYYHYEKNDKIAYLFSAKIKKLLARVNFIITPSLFANINFEHFHWQHFLKAVNA